jgi:hypothetical protein
MTTKLLNQEPALNNIRQFGVFDDFRSYDTDDILWTDLQADGSATVAIDADGVGGIVDLTVDTNDDEEASLYTTNELFNIIVDKPIYAICRYKINTATSINACAAMWGLVNAPGANTIVDATGAPAASKQGIMIAKAVDAADVKVYAHSTGASGGYLADQSKTTDQDLVDNTWVTQAFLVEPISSSEKRVTFYHDPAGGVNLKQMKDTDGNLIQLTQTLADASATELALFMGIKNASTDAQVMSVDFIGCWRLR